MNEMTLEPKEKEELALLGKGLAAEFIGLIEGNIEISAKTFRSEDISEAQRIYIQLIDDLQLFFEMLREIRKINQIDMGEAQLEKISALLEELISTYAYEDWVMVADLLEYELIPFLEGIKGVILAS